MSDDLYRIGQSINTIMDMEESEKIKRFVVSPGIDSSLDGSIQIFLIFLSTIINTFERRETRVQWHAGLAHQCSPARVGRLARHDRSVHCKLCAGNGLHAGSAPLGRRLK